MRRRPDHLGARPGKTKRAAGAPHRGNIFGAAAVLLFGGCSLYAVLTQ